MQSTSSLKSNALVETNTVLITTPKQNSPPSTKSVRDVALQTNEVVVYKPGLLACFGKKPVAKTLAATSTPKAKPKSTSFLVTLAKFIGCYSKPNNSTSHTNQESYEFEKKDSIPTAINPEPTVGDDLPGEITPNSTALSQVSSIPKKTLIQLKEAREKLIHYYEEKGIKKKSEDIDGALKEFEELGCQWAQMKKSTNIEHLFIIGDLRAIHLTNICDYLKIEFSDLQVIDRGSDDPTSDRDLSFKLPPGREYLEPTIAKRFKDLFNEAWGINSAIVFDTNPYTEFHVKNLFNPHLIQSEAFQSLKMSLVMYRLTTEEPETKVHWESLTKFNVTEEFIQQLLKEMGDKLKDQIPPRVFKSDIPNVDQLKSFINGRMSELFSNVEDYYNNLNNQLNEAIFKLNYPNQPLPEEKELKGIVNKLIQNNPSLKLNAMSDLQESNRLGAKDSYSQRMKIEDLLNLTEPEKFNEVFEKAIEAAIRHKTENTKRQIESINNGNDSNKDKKIARLNSNLTKELALLDNLRNEKFNITGLCKNNLNKEINDLNNEIQSIKDQISQIQKKIEKGNINPSQLNWLQSKIKQSQESLNLCQKKQEELNKKLRNLNEADLKNSESSIENSPLFTEFQTITEELFLVQKRFDEKGRCFQVEANVTSEAFHTSIGQIPPVAGLEFILPAFTEIHAFSLAHSAKHHDNYRNLIESSKYVYRQLNLISKAENSLPPILYSDSHLNLKNLKGYYETIYELRKNPKDNAEQIELNTSKQYNIPRTSNIQRTSQLVRANTQVTATRSSIIEEPENLKEETDAKTLASFFNKFHAQLIVYNMLLDKVTTVA